MHWSADGQLFLAALGVFPGPVYRRNLITGRIEPWRTLAPSDPTGVQAIGDVLIANDERSYVYVYSRGLNELFLARDLR